MPFPSTRVIHPDWAGHHRPVVAGTWTATAVIETADPDQPGDWRTRAPAGALTLWGPGQVRVQALSERDTRRVDSAGQLITDRAYLVAGPHTIPLDLPTGQQRAWVRVTDVDANADPDLVGRRLRVANAATGSLVWERDLICVDDLTNPAPAPEGGDG